MGPETSVLPVGWESRLVKIQNANTDLKIGYCLEPHDLPAAKLAAGREKDWEFVRVMLSHGLAQPDTLNQRIASLPISEARKTALLRWVQGVARANGP